METEEGYFAFTGLLHVNCLFDLLLDIIGRLCSVIVALTRFVV